MDVKDASYMSANRLEAARYQKYPPCSPCPHPRLLWIPSSLLSITIHNWHSNGDSATTLGWVWVCRLFAVYAECGWLGILRLNIFLNGGCKKAAEFCYIIIHDPFFLNIFVAGQWTRVLVSLASCRLVSVLLKRFGFNPTSLVWKRFVRLELGDWTSCRT